MNNYGVIVDDIGLKSWISSLRQQYISSLVSLLFPHKNFTLRSHHAFVIKYKVGEDTNLATHVDLSDITVNVCLGKEFKDGTLYFHSLKGTDENENDNKQTNSTKKESNNKGSYHSPHSVKCSYCKLDYSHTIGVGVVHLGDHIHGANHITAGERSNLIIWYRTAEQLNKDKAE